MIKLKLKGYRAPYLCARYPDKLLSLSAIIRRLIKEIDVELVPYGCTNLRITYFPKADLKNINLIFEVKQTRRCGKTILKNRLAAPLFAIRKKLL